MMLQKPRVCIFTTTPKVNTFFSSFDRDGAFHTEYNRAVTFKVNLPPSFSAELESEWMPKVWQLLSERRKGRVHK